MRIFRLNTTVIECRDNATAFLNGLTSNSLDKPMNAFLTIHGRIITTVNQCRIDDGLVLLIVPQEVVAGLMTHLSRYAKLSKTQLKVQSSMVYADLENNMPLLEEDKTVSYRNARLVITQRQLENTIDERAFNNFRLAHHLPLQGIDFKTDEMILNVSGDDYVSFTKGCYLGQEPVAKVQHRAKPTWKLVVKYQDECSIEEKEKLTSLTADPLTNRLRGFVFVKNI